MPGGRGEKTRLRMHPDPGKPGEHGIEVGVIGKGGIVGSLLGVPRALADHRAPSEEERR